MSSVTEDTVLSGHVTLFQPERGFRAGTDSLLLAASLSSRDGMHALEVGCGCGGALLPAAWRCAGARFTGLEVDPVMAALARRGAMANGFGLRVRAETGEASDWVRERENSFDMVFANPPYFEAGTISPPGEGKEEAYITPLTLEEWIKAMLFTARPRAPVILIHRASELARILTALDRRTGEITVLPIHTQAGDPAKRVIIRARKGLKRGDVKLLAGECLYNADKTPSTFLAAMEAGEAIRW